MIIQLVKIIENLVIGDKDRAIAYAELAVENTKRHYEADKTTLNKCDLMTAKNVLHVLKGEPKEGGIAVCD